MAEFSFPPEWANAPPPQLPDVDPDRIEGLQNGFLAATHEALHNAPDAFFRKAGQDAVEAVPAVQERLSQLRDATLEGAKDEGERAALAPRLGAGGGGAKGWGLSERDRERLPPADQRSLDVPIQAARTDVAADAWIARETDKQGEPLAARVQVDPELSPEQKATVLAKVEAQASAKASGRIAAVKGLDDRLDVTTRTLSTAPATYTAGTLAAIADGYDDAGEPDKASAARRLALQEGFLLP